MSEHRDAPVGEMHPIANWVFASIGERDALVPALRDVGKVCRVENVGHFALDAVTPVTWRAVGGDAVTELAYSTKTGAFSITRNNDRDASALHGFVPGSVDYCTLLRSKCSTAQPYFIRDTDPVTGALRRAAFGVGMRTHGSRSTEFEFRSDADGLFLVKYGYVNHTRHPSVTVQAQNLKDAGGAAFALASLSRAGDNAWFTNLQVGFSFELPFTGIGLIARYFADDRGGVWKCRIDDTFDVYFTCYSATTVSDNTVTLCNGLADTAHTAVFTFIGGDAAAFSNVDMAVPGTTGAGFPRGWFKYDDRVNISGITNANPGVFTTTAAHNFNVGAYVDVEDVTGAVEANTRWYVQSTPAADTFTISATAGGAAVDTSAWGVYAGAGSVTSGGEFTTGLVITGAEAAMDWVGKTLIATGILEFAISCKHEGAAWAADWVPAHGVSTGATVPTSQRLFIDGRERSIEFVDVDTTADNETLIDELLLVQEYTAYNSNDAGKAYPLWNGVLTHKFDRDGLHITHELVTLRAVDVSFGYTAHTAGKTSALGKQRCNNGVQRTVTVPGGSNLNTYPGYCTSIMLYNQSTGNALANTVHSLQDVVNTGEAFESAFPVHMTDRPDDIGKAYFVQIGAGSVVPSGTKLQSSNTLFLATDVPGKALL